MDHKVRQHSPRLTVPGRLLLICFCALLLLTGCPAIRSTKSWTNQWLGKNVFEYINFLNDVGSQRVYSVSELLGKTYYYEEKNGEVAYFSDAMDLRDCRLEWELEENILTGYRELGACW